MGSETAISWTNSTWNPATGCTKVSPGCQHCYMYRDMVRYGKDPTAVTRTAPGTFRSPIARTREGGFKLPGPLIFTASWTDVFHVDLDTFRGEAWEIIRERDRIERGEGLPRSYFQILTKRADRIAAQLPPDWGDGYPNVWLGVTIESQPYAWRADRLREVPAVVRFISYEPACGPVEWAPVLPGIHWLIAGGESGGKARPAHPAWFRAARDAAASAGVTFHFKQWGEWAPWVNEEHFTHGGVERYAHAWIDGETGDSGHCWITDDDGLWSNWTGDPRGHAAEPDVDGHSRLHPAIAVLGWHGKKAAGRVLDGRTWDEFPEVAGA